MADRSIIKCTGCQSSLAVRPDLAGKKIRCPQCQTVHQVAATAADSRSLANSRSAPPVAQRRVAAQQAATPSTAVGQATLPASNTAYVYIDCGQCREKLAILIASSATAFRCPHCRHINRPQPLSPGRSERQPSATSANAG